MFKQPFLFEIKDSSIALSLKISQFAFNINLFFLNANIPFCQCFPKVFAVIKKTTTKFEFIRLNVGI
jgi:hypothetical protein